EQTDQPAEAQPFFDAASAFVAFAVDERRREHGDERAGGEDRHVAHVFGWPVDVRVSTELTGQERPVHHEPINHVDDGTGDGGGGKATVVHHVLLFTRALSGMKRAEFTRFTPGAEPVICWKEN